MGVRSRGTLMACALALIAACSPDATPLVEQARDASPTPEGRTSSVEPQSTDPALTVPAESSGPLDADSVLAPDSLGAGWATFVDSGAAGDGYVGNASFVRERDGDELIASFVPFGCADRPPALPRPQHALEATYRHEDGSAAVVVIMEFAGEDAAHALIVGLGAIVSACPRTPPDAGQESPYRLEIEVLHHSAAELRDVRRERGEGASEARWVEVAVQDKQRVALAMVEVQPGGPGPALDRLSERLSEAAALGQPRRAPNR